MLIPTVIALSNFFILNFPHVSWYPYWYLGNPFNYLIGPLVPFSLLILNKAFFLPVPFAYFFLISLSFLIGASGLYFLIRSLGEEKRESFTSAILFLILPFSPYLLFYQNGLHHIAFGFLPWILLLFLKLIKNFGPKNAIFLSIAIAFVLLIDVSILLRILIGFVTLAVALKPDRQNAEKLLILTGLAILASLSISTIWYTPGFWFVVLSNPSFGGIPMVKLVQFLFQLILQLLPIFLAVSFVRWRHLRLSKTLLFGVLFFSSFFFLTVVRFLSDPDFIMDWIGFVLELQFGGAIILGNIKYKILKIKNTYKILKIFLNVCVVILLIVGWLIVVREASSALSKGGYQSRILSILKEVPKNERVFLSGTPVFFANSYLDISQVRGGMDQVSIHPFWADAAFQTREGENSSLAENWLKVLGVSSLLVHEKDSAEPFHDFKHPEKFTDFRLIVEEKGDKLYKIEDATIARIADQSLLSIPPPQNGADRKAIFSYVKNLGKPFAFQFKKGQIEISGNTSDNEIISLAVTFDSHFKLMEGKGRVVKDGMGNTAILPRKEGEQRFILKYKLSPIDYGVSIVVSVIFLYLLISYDKIIPKARKFLPKFHIGLSEENEY